MPNFAANLSWLFTELDFLDRFKAAKEAGFNAVECLSPYEHHRFDIAAKLKEHDLQQVLFNMALGDWDKGERGIAILPERREDFKESLAMAMAYADTLDCKKIHCMAGIIPDECDLFELEATYVSNLRYAAEEAASAGITLLIEPINSIDVPGYYLNYTEQASSVIEKVGADNLAIQFDVYHVQKTQGDIANTFKTYQNQIGHIQIADNPGRNEPGSGEINFDFLFQYFDELGYNGHISAEYTPKTTTQAGLDWFNKKQIA